MGSVHRSQASCGSFAPKFPASHPGPPGTVRLSRLLARPLSRPSSADCGLERDSRLATPLDAMTAASGPPRGGGARIKVSAPASPWKPPGALLNYDPKCENSLKFIYQLIHRQGFPGGSVVKNPPISAGDAEEPCAIPESGRSSGGGNGN